MTRELEKNVRDKELAAVDHDGATLQQYFKDMCLFAVRASVRDAAWREVRLAGYLDEAGEEARQWYELLKLCVNVT